ncbi:Reverse transcriptase RNA-dependent DNA polymerase [Penicillium sp. IBT 16267x]|nr:Reverse transcriptase RNA-dependent DNA polymerase [Penicillium sp. IBT 16267x]
MSALRRSPRKNKLLSYKDASSTSSDDELAALLDGLEAVDERLPYVLDGRLCDPAIGDAMTDDQICMAIYLAYGTPYNMVTPEEVTQYKAEIREHMLDYRMLLRVGSTCLMKSLSVSAKQHVHGIKGFIQVFDALRKQYATYDFRAKTRLYSKWSRLTFNKGELVTAFISKFQLALHLYESSSEHVPPQIVFQEFLIAVSANPNGSRFIETLSYTSIDKTTMDDVYSRLRSFYESNIFKLDHTAAATTSTSDTTPPVDSGRGGKGGRGGRGRGGSNQDQSTSTVTEGDKEDRGKVWCPYHWAFGDHFPSQCKQKNDPKKIAAAKQRAAIAAATTESTPPAPPPAPTAPAKPATSNLVTGYQWTNATIIPNQQAAVTTSASENPLRWMLDSGTTAHMTPYRSSYINFTYQRMPIQTATGDVFWAEGYGDILLDLAAIDGSLMGSITLHKVYHAPALAASLISISGLLSQGISVQFDDPHAILHLKGSPDPIGYAVLESSHFWLNVGSSNSILTLMTEEYPESLTPSAGAYHTTVKLADGTTPIPLELAHRRMVHAGERRVKNTVRHADGLSLKSGTAIPDHCVPCIKGKGHALPFGRNKRVKSAPDDASRFTWLYLMTSRDEVLECYKQVEAFLHTQLSMTVRRVCGDNAAEHTPLARYLAERGMVWDSSPPYTPQLNGIPEIKNRWLVEPLVAVMTEHKLPKHLWGEVIQGVNYTCNRLWHSKIDRTPYEALFGRKPDISTLRALGCQCWYLLDKSLRPTKLHPHMHEARLLGYDEWGNYSLYDVETRSLVRSRHVVFNETTLREIPNSGFHPRVAYRRALCSARIRRECTHSDCPTTTEGSCNPAGTHTTPRSLLDTAEMDDGRQPGLLQDTEDTAVEAQSSDEAVARDDAQEGGAIVELRRSGRVRRPPNRPLDSEFRYFLTDKSPAACARVHLLTAPLDTDLVHMLTTPEHLPALFAAATTVSGRGFEPATWKEAMSCPEKEKWKVAAHTEFRNHIRNGTWRMVPKQAYMKLLPTKWVFKIKSDGTYKARLVVKGFRQRVTEFGDIYASVAKSMTFKAFVAVAAHRGWHLHHVDIVAAFLHAQLKEALHMELPEPFEAEYPDMCGLLQKTLYGLKQSPREWFNLIRDVLLAEGFTQGTSDHCLFIKNDVFLLVYVDDILVLSPAEHAIQGFKTILLRHFDITDKGPATEFLGIQIVRLPDGRICLSQRAYVDSCLHRFGYDSIKPCNKPYDEKVILTDYSQQATPAEIKAFQERVGCLIWLLVNTRVDIAYSVTKLARYARNPGPDHHSSIQKTWRYLSGHKDMVICYLPSSQLAEHAALLHGFTDSDWAGPHAEARLSTSGYLFKLAGAAVSWQSKKQTSVALSSTEAEYMAQCHAVQELVWLILLLTELSQLSGMTDLRLFSKPVNIFADNQGAIALASNPENHARSKHVDIKFHYQRRQVEAGNCRFTYIPTENMPADGLTKPLPTTAFRRFVHLTGLTSLPA